MQAKIAPGAKVSFCLFHLDPLATAVGRAIQSGGWCKWKLKLKIPIAAATSTNLPACCMHPRERGLKSVY